MEDMIPFQGLRGICSMAIFLGHQTEMFLKSPWAPHWQQPMIVGLEFLQAVSLFFLLSGIPLARLYTSSGKLDTWDGCYEFWWKRFARLAPIYYLTLTLNLLILFLICQEMDIMAAIESFLGCAFLIQSWFVSLINVGGALWQVAVFAFGYLLFPFLSGRIRQQWNDNSLYGGIVISWLFSAALWCGFDVWVQPKGFGWWIWHVHCLSRLPHIVAGILLGEIVERKRAAQRRGGGGDSHLNGSNTTTTTTATTTTTTTMTPRAWGILTDAISFLLLLTAIQAPIVQWYYGSEIRSFISIGLEAWLLPIHALWLAGMVLAYQQENNEQGCCYCGCGCWTRRVLSFGPLKQLGDVSLVLYCIHLVVLFLYTSTYAYLTTGGFRIAPSIVDYTLRVQTPWWPHAPIQWVLVIWSSFVVSKWFEAPLRKWIVSTIQINSNSNSNNNAERISSSTAPPIPSEKTPLVSSI